MNELKKKKNFTKEKQIKTNSEKNKKTKKKLSKKKSKLKMTNEIEIL